MAVKKEVVKVLYGTFTERGPKRPVNTDNYGIYPQEETVLSRGKGQLFLVADSKFRNPAGKNAGQIVIEAVQKNYFAYPSDDIVFSLQRAFDIANRTLYQYAVASGLYRKIGATCTALVINEQYAYFAHVGDCRIYHVNLRRAEQITVDHARIVENGDTQTPPKTTLTRAMGIKLGIKIDLGRLPLQRDEYFVIASDGLNNIPKEELQRIVLSSSPERAAEKLAELARSQGASDDITVQVIKIYQQSTENYGTLGGAVVGELNASWANWPIYFMLALLFGTMVFLVHEPILEQTRSWVASRQLNQRSNALPPAVDPQALEMQQLVRAKTYFNKGLWDEALKEYRAVLRNNPASSEASEGIDMVVRAYVARGDKAFNQENWGAALAYYQKAYQLNPENADFTKLILRTKQKLYQTRSMETALASVPQTLQYREANSPLTPQDALKTLNIVGFARDQWFFSGLNEKEDYVITPRSLAFVDNLRIKKIFHKIKYDAVEVEVQTRRLRGSRNGKYGIIFGHYLDDDAPGEAFFLYSVDSNGNFSVQQVTRHSVKILVSEPIKPGIIGNYDQIHLRVKSLGKLVLLYANGVLLKMLPLAVEQSGGVGLYTDPKMQVEFTDFRIQPTTQKVD
jgi:serine/threonine protein phosphatase PrpC